MKINVLMVSVDREAYEDTALRYLVDALEGTDYDIYVNNNGEICHIDVDGVDYFPEDRSDDFRKGYFYNQLEGVMMKDFDYIMYLDVDVILRPDIISVIKSTGNVDYSVLGGYKLTKESSEKVIKEHPKWNDIVRLKSELKSVTENERKCYVGNICLKKECYDKYREITEQKYLHNPEYRIWGHEDSEISITSTYMANKGLINKRYFLDAWRHLEHPRPCEQADFDNGIYNKNGEIMKMKLHENRQKIDRHIANNK